MKTLREKLHSQSGASILLALLFLLVCMMTAASILMAAVSNAGKLRSNRIGNRRKNNRNFLIHRRIVRALRAGRRDSANHVYLIGNKSVGNLSVRCRIRHCILNIQRQVLAFHNPLFRQSFYKSFPAVI